MRRYELQDVTVQREVGRECNGCGVSEEDVDWLTPVVIAVNAGEEQGGVDELDYCEPCLTVRAPALVAAGSTAEYVTGLPQGPVLSVDARRNLTGRLLELRDQWRCTSAGESYADALTDLLEEIGGES